MPRRGNVPKREILPDPMYNSVLVTKLVNSIMLDGKKGVAQKVVYGAFDIIKEKTEKEPLEVFTQAMENIMPSLEVKARRVGGATYQVPMEVRPARRQTLGLRWLTAYSRARGERTMAERLAGEIMDAANNTGSAVKKREDTHKMAESNKADAYHCPFRVNRMGPSKLGSFISLYTATYSTMDTTMPLTGPRKNGWSRNASAGTEANVPPVIRATIDPTMNETRPGTENPSSGLKFCGRALRTNQ